MDILRMLEITVAAFTIIGGLYLFIRWLRRKLHKTEVLFTVAEIPRPTREEQLRDALRGPSKKDIDDALNG